MNIYKAETSIRDTILNNKTVLCFSEAKTDITDIVKASVNQKIANFAAGNIDNKYLFPHQSILVTTSWNGNDDIFLPEQTWAARHSPSHMPTNIEHDSVKIVGHIIDNHALTADFELIDDATAVDDLPDKFHILTSSVIYREWHSDAEYQEQVADLIQRIENGDMFVSMECKFKDFGYALQDQNGTISVINRNQDTAFLSLSLRSFGGDGFYRNHRIGRVLKDITFIGKGYTTNPANKESVVFSPSSLFSFSNLKFSEKLEDFENDGVLLNSNKNTNGDFLMPVEPNTDKSQELAQLNAELKAELASLKEQLTKADVKTYEAQITVLNDEKKVLSASVESLKEDLASVNTEVVSTKSLLEESVAKVAEVEAAKVELEKEVTELKAANVLADRRARLVDAGYSTEDADRKATIFANLNDEQFEVIVAELTEQLETKKKAGANTPDLDELDADEEESVADLDEEDEEEATAGYEDEDEEMSEVATSFANLLGQHFSKNLRKTK